MIKLGKRNEMKVLREVDFGVYLDGGDMGDVLLPKRYIPEGTKVGDVLDVFLYLDQQERLIATNEHPLIEVGQIAFLEVKWVNQFGAFLDWGLMKDLFCPFREQKMRMQQGRKYIVYCYIDSLTHRIVATAKIEKFLSKEQPPYNKGDIVNILIQQKTELGFKAIVEGQFSGQLYQNELFKDIHTGDQMPAIVKNVREDGKIDLVLQEHGKKHIDDFEETLLEYLKENGGVCAFHDKSDAEDIYSEFQVSKKTFKKAVGGLYKKHLISIEENGLRLRWVL
ncbi:MAG: GntR family transcriptional regulator [Prevotellaceae bacterium]|nr:GntR family transcriptional regulator [Candidatus Colivivens equi]MCQ2078231.1 S1-like domain-containing RNA-binding protein [Bacteroidaceae bacterium]